MKIDRNVQFAIQQKASTTFNAPSQIDKFYRRLEDWKKMNEAKKNKVPVVHSSAINN